MTTPAQSKQLARLTNLLQDLFQLNQPELDFGLYKIMHAKSEQITRFLEHDLLQEVQTAFGTESTERVAQAQAQLDQAILQATKFGAPDPDATPGVQEARAACDAARDSGNTEAQVYDHLYRFFERYYDSGDFLSRRYYARESDTRAAPYSVPYDGREVYLHWANKDQYYIKSSEALTNYRFDLRQAVQLHGTAAASGQLDFGDTAGTDTAKPLRVHFRIASAAEGEHGNIKASADQKRTFVPLLSQPLVWEGEAELVLQFEYKALPEGLPIDAATEAALKTRYDFSAKEPLAAHWMADVFIRALQDNQHPQALDYARLLAHPAPTDKQKKRPLLARYIAQYTARNTMDYFIHKDLGGFLRRELDFYLKNEVMRLDDIASADAPRVEQYLGQLKVLRRIAHSLIAFLAQLEDFQKKLWLKKKFVTAAHYCITLDRVPPALYPAIAANEAQRAEWVRLFAIDEIAADTTRPGYSVPLTVEFLKGNPFLLVDTALFDDEFKSNLLAEIENLDAQCDGVLIHSENFQALGLMHEKLKEKVKFIYIDPPYNTGDDGFSYKDGYKSATWLSMISDRVKLGRGLNTNDGVIFASIDDKEVHNLDWALSTSYGFDPDAYPMIWHLPRGINAGHIAKAHEYILPYFVNRAKTPKFNKPAGLEQISIERCNKQVDARHPASQITFPAGVPFEGESATFTDEIPGSERIEIVSKKMIFEDCKLKFPVTLSAGWTVKNMILTWLDNKPVFDSKGQPIKRFFFKMNGKLYYEKDVTTFSAKSVIAGIADTQDATAELLNILGVNNFTYPKSSEITKYLMQLATNKNDYLLDYFAGSGTTGHAAIKINREDGGSRKYILVEMGEYFDKVLKPRIQKAVFSNAWENGKPINREGISHCFKYLRLESYEDTLNNLSLQTDPARDRALADNPALRQDYVLNYWLDVETQGSQSLLNVAAFRDPTAYTMRIKQPGSEAQMAQRIDLIETFNWLIGLWVQHLGAPVTLAADFAREPDPELPGDTQTRLLCTRLRPAPEGPYWFRLVEGYTLATPGDDSTRQKTLVVWRKLSGSPEHDNAVLQKYLLEKLQISPRENVYAVIYVNGSHTLPNPVVEGEKTRVRLTEEAFHTAMWSQAGA